MKPLLRSRVLIACCALLCMLFMQLVVASTICPMESRAAQVMTDCDGMDMPHPVLCHTHAAGEALKLSLDKPDLPQIQPFILSQLVLEIQPPDFSATSSVIQPARTPFNQATSPPIAILHCCFRI